jgi:hypothetical protein
LLSELFPQKTELLHHAPQKVETHQDPVDQHPDDANHNHLCDQKIRAQSVPRQSSALRTVQGLLPARHLHPVLYTEYSVVDTECLCWPRITPRSTL